MTVGFRGEFEGTSLFTNVMFSYKKLYELATLLAICKSVMFPHEIRLTHFKLNCSLLDNVVNSNDQTEQTKSVWNFFHLFIVWNHIDMTGIC